MYSQEQIENQNNLINQLREKISEFENTQLRMTNLGDIEFRLEEEKLNYENFIA